MSFSYELMLCIYSIVPGLSTIFRRGERVAQLIPHEMLDLEFKQISEEEYVNHNRGGFGSSGLRAIEKKAA